MINGSQLPPQERGMLSRTVHGDMRIEPLYGKHRLKDVFVPLRNRFFRHLGTNSSKLYIEIEGEFYRITVGGIWEGGPTIDADDPPGVIVIIPNGNLSRSSTTNLSVKILRRNQTVHTESYVSVGYSERVYETKKPGNYIVEISWNGESVTETFNISFDTLADCNSDKYRITFGQNSPEIDVSSTAEGCTDPADVSSNG
ncbi:MAG: hypothetical protein SV760_00195 [Halobacteria archaeon]|nr:hypothetical protein [Halobacteria archaeon]